MAAPPPATADEGARSNDGPKDARPKAPTAQSPKAPAPRAQPKVAEKRPRALTIEEAIRDKVNQQATIEFRVAKAALVWHTGFGARQPFVLILTPKVVLTLEKGVYRYVCDPHASFMHGSFRVV